MRSNLRWPSSFPHVLNTTFGIMTATYLSVAGLAYYYFGDFVHDILTEDFETQSPLQKGTRLFFFNKGLQVSMWGRGRLRVW